AAAQGRTSLPSPPYTDRRLGDLFIQHAYRQGLFLQDLRDIAIQAAANRTRAMVSQYSVPARHRFGGHPDQIRLRKPPLVNSNRAIAVFQNRPLRPETGPCRQAHGNRLATPEAFLNSADAARMSVEGHFETKSEALSLPSNGLVLLHLT